MIRFASIALPCFALDRDVFSRRLCVACVHTAAASLASSRRLAPNDAPASTLVKCSHDWASEASPTWVIHLGFFIGASAAKPHMDDTSAIFHIYIIGASAAKPHMDDTSAIFHIYIIYY